MRFQKASGSKERRILIGMIVSLPVLSRIAAKWEKEGMFGSQWANLVGQWCVDYHATYRKAPGKHITALFESWAEDSNDKDTVAIVERFLESLSGEYAALAKEVNADLIIDMAGEHFNKVRLERHKDAIEGDLEEGKVRRALERFTKFREVELGEGTWIDVLRDKAAIQKAFEDKKEPLIVYKDGLGDFFGGALERDAFIAFTGPEKRGKSWWLLEIAWTAMRQGRKVAFFEVGDLSQSQVMRRFMTRASRRPLKLPKGRKERIVQVPTAIRMTEDGLEVDYEPGQWKGDLTWERAWRNCEKIIGGGRSKDPLLRLSCHPNSSISVRGIDSLIVKAEIDGWSPDVIVVDYADILAPVNGTADTRDQINTTWKLLRRMSQERHALVVTATQSDAASYDAPVIGKKNFSEDKRKHAHVTGMIGINQDDKEKERGIQRLNWVDLREGEFVESEVCHVAGCLAIANIAMKSVF